MGLIEFKDVNGNFHWLVDSSDKHNKIRACGYSDGKFGYFIFDTLSDCKVELSEYFRVWHVKDAILGKEYHYE